MNSDDPEAVMHVCNVAADWRRTFKKVVALHRLYCHKYVIFLLQYKGRFPVC